MASKEILIGRAKVSAKLSRSIMNRKFANDLSAIAPRDEDGDMVVIPAAPFEPAVFAIHRMDREKSPIVVVATIIDTTLHVSSFRRAQIGEFKSRKSIGSGMTVAEWFAHIERTRGTGEAAFAADGAEFAADLSSSMLTSA